MTLNENSDSELPTIYLKPQEGPQSDFLRSSADIAIYGGAAGGGKTWGLLLEPLREIKRTRGFGAVIFRRTSVQIRNEGAMWDESFSIYPLLDGTPHESTLHWVFPPYDNTITFAHMEHEKDRLEWQGSQIAYIGFDELTHFTEEMFFYMFSRNRSTCGVKPYIRATTNPDADSWVATFIAWWIDQNTGLPIPEHAGKLRWFVRVADRLHWASSPQELASFCTAGILPKSVTFIPANVHDNSILMAKDPGYLSNLYALNFVERERLLGGNWKIRPAAGMVFNRAWFQIIDACPHDVIARIRYWDKAATEGGGAYTCGVKMARTENNLFIVEDVIRGQWSSMQRERVIEETAKMDGPNVYVWVEQEPGSGGKESAENTVRRLAGYVAHADRVTGDKLARAEPYAAQVEAGNTYLVRADWNKQYIDELDSFPDGRYVDQADASSGAFNKLAAALIIEGPSDEVLYGIPANEYGGRI